MSEPTPRPPTLSICIPTYRMGAELGELLDSLLPQVDDAVEVCVSDNASDDATREIVEARRARFPALRYHRQPENVGIDRNILQAVALASGDWCWLMGADDLVPPGALALVRERLAGASSEVAVVNGLRLRMDVDEDPPRERVEDWFPAWKDGDLVRPAGAAAAEYFRGCPGLGAVFSYLSTLIVRRRRWEETPVDPVHLGRWYVHVAKILGALEAGGALLVVKQVIVRCRYRRIAPERLAARWLLDLEGYQAIGERVVSDPAARRELWAILRREHPPQVFIRLRRESDGPSWRRIRRLLAQLAFPRHLIWRYAAVGGALRLRDHWYLLKHRVKLLLRGRGDAGRGGGAS